MALTLRRLCPEIGAPVVTPSIKVMIASGARGSRPAGISRRM